MLIGPSEQGVVSTLLRYLYIKEWERNPIKIQGPPASLKCLGVLWCGACWDILSKVKDKLFPLAPPTTEKEVQHLMGLFRFQRWHIPHFVVLFQPITEWPKKLLILSGAQNKRMLCRLITLDYFHHEKGQHFVPTGIDTLKMNLPFLHAMLLPKLPSMDLQNTYPPLWYALHHWSDQGTHLTVSEVQQWNGITMEW